MTILFKRLTFTLLFIPLLIGQSIHLKQSTFSSSAVVSSGDNAKLSATVGQPFSTKIESGNTILNSGFWVFGFGFWVLGFGFWDKMTGGNWGK